MRWPEPGPSEPAAQRSAPLPCAVRRGLGLPACPGRAGEVRPLPPCPQLSGAGSSCERPAWPTAFLRRAAPRRAPAAAHPSPSLPCPYSRVGKSRHTCGAEPLLPPGLAGAGGQRTAADGSGAVRGNPREEPAAAGPLRIPAARL